MKTQVSICALLLSVSLLHAQTEDKPVTIRVKKIENINGVEKVSDSTYTVKGPVNIHHLEGLNIKETECLKDGKTKKIVIVTDDIKGKDGELKDISKEELMDEQIQAALKAAGVDSKTSGADKMLVLNVEAEAEGEKGEKKVTKIMILKKVKITEASEEETNQMAKKTGTIDQKLNLDKLNFYPNPSNGKFHLNFKLSTTGTTEIGIFNMEGKSVYNESLKDFSGSYDKEIDISSHPKGVYFVKVKQGEHAQLKKIVME